MSSYYEDERRRYQPARDRSRRDSYDNDTRYTTRDSRSSALVRRRESYDDADGEVTRDFPPGRGGYIRETTVRKSGTRPARTRSFEDDRYYDDRYDDRSYASGRRSSRQHDARSDRRSRRYSSDYSSRSRSRTPPRRDRRKSKSEDALEALGLGGLAATLLGKKERSRSRSRDRDRNRNRSRGRDRAYSEDRYSSRRRSKSRGPSKEQIAQALKAAVLAGAGEAFRARKEPGGWGGEKGKRVLTAAFSAGGVDGLISSNRNQEDHKTRNAIGSAIAGIATSRIVNGPTSGSRGRNSSRSPNGRGRSQSRGGLGDIAAGGVLAATVKKAYDSVRSRSRGPARSSSRSSSEYSDTARSTRNKSRRRSLSRTASRGLAALGLRDTADRMDPDRPRSRRSSPDYDDRFRGGRGYGDNVGQPRSGSVNGRARSVSQPRSDWDVARRTGTPSGYSLDYGPHHYGDPETDSSSDLGSSTDEEKERKKGRKKQFLTTGLATIATIHAGNNVYQSYNKREARKKALKEGRIDAEQAKENRNKDRLQDAASIGLAALGIKGAYSEWKEMADSRKEFKENIDKIQEHKLKRRARRRKAEMLDNPPPPPYTHDGHGYTNSMPNLHSPQPMAPPPMGNHSSYFDQNGPRNDTQGPYHNPAPPNLGPHYADDNPYHVSSTAAPYYPPAPNFNSNTSTLPRPPMGSAGYPNPS